MLVSAAAAARRRRGDRAGGRARRRGRRAARPRACATRPTGSSERGIAERVIFDLGLVRDLGYYTGAIFEVYDPALGHIIGGGGRYDDLLGRFGRPLPACGFALFVERVHVAQAEEERRASRGASRVRRRERAARSPQGALFEDTLDLLDSVGVDTSPLRSDSRSLLFPGARADARHDAAERRADLRRGGRGRPRHHRQGRADGAAGARRLRAARPRLRPLPDGRRDAGRATTSPTSSSGASARSGSRPSTRASPRATSSRAAGRPR